MRCCRKSNAAVAGNMSVDSSQWAGATRLPSFDTDAFTNACKALYRSIVNSGTWGVSALNRMSGINFDALSEAERRRMSVLPAMIYHGVKTEDAVLMRMNAAPRSAAERLGEMYRADMENADSRYSVSRAREFLRSMSSADWMRAVPKGVALSGEGYRRVWPRRPPKMPQLWPGSKCLT